MTRFLKVSVLGLVLAGGMVAASEAAVVVARAGLRAPVAVRVATPGQMIWLNPQPEPQIFLPPRPVVRRAIIRR